MKLVGNLKEQVGRAGDKEEARGLIKKAGMLLTDDELDMVSGGHDEEQYDVPIKEGDCKEAWCEWCGRVTLWRYIGDYKFHCTGGCDRMWMGPIWETS